MTYIKIIYIYIYLKRRREIGEKAYLTKYRDRAILGQVGHGPHPTDVIIR